MIGLPSFRGRTHVQKYAAFIGAKFIILSYLIASQNSSVTVVALQKTAHVFVRKYSGSESVQQIYEDTPMRSFLSLTTSRSPPRSFAAHLLQIVAKDAVLVSDGREAYGAFANSVSITATTSSAERPILSAAITALRCVGVNAPRAVSRALKSLISIVRPRASNHAEIMSLH